MPRTTSDPAEGVIREQTGKALERLDVVFRGKRFSLSRDEVIALAQTALAAGRGKAQKLRRYFVDIGGRRIAPKWLVSEITGIPTNGFSTSDAVRVLNRIGVKVRRSR